MRQADLVDALDHVIARSTLANVEVGRENPSPRLWQAICTHLPDWVETLEPVYEPTRTVQRELPFELAGPFEIIQATYAYTFRAHRAPEEILQVRRVRATTDGADGYGLKLTNNSGRFDLDTESLWGGWVASHRRDLTHDSSQHLVRFHFDQTLKRGQVHEFATRSWVSHDEPADRVSLGFTRPTGEVTLALNFTGPRPQQVRRFGPLDDIEQSPDEPLGGDEVTPMPNGSCQLHVKRPILGKIYGLAWAW